MFLIFQVITSNLQGQQSVNAYWRKYDPLVNLQTSSYVFRYPSISIFQYQCSPLSASESIQHQV